MEWNLTSTTTTTTNDNTTTNTASSSTGSSSSSNQQIASMATVMKIADEMVRQHQQLLVAYQQQQQQQQTQTQQLLTASSNAPTTTGLRSCCVTLIKLLDNLLKYPSDSNTTTAMCHKVRRINLLNPNIQQSIVQYPPTPSTATTATTTMMMNHQQQITNHHSLGVSFLLACGFLKGSDITTTATSSRTSIGDAMIDQNTLLLLPQNENTQHIIKAKQVLVNICIYELHIPINEIPTGVPQQLQQNTNSTHNTMNNNPSMMVQQPVLPGGFNPYQGSRIDVTGQQPPAFTTTAGSNSKIDLELQRLQNAQQKLLAEQQQSTKNGNGKDREWTMSILSSSDGSIPTATTSTNTTTSAAVGITSNSSSNKGGDGALLAHHIQQQSLERQKRENSGFTTKAMRDIERLKKSRIYTHVTLSIHIKLLLVPTKSNSATDSTNNNLPATVDIQLIGKFLPNETISNVMDAIRSDCFEENNMLHQKKIHFELYSTPPMIVYNNIQQTLLQEQLVPASKLFLRWTPTATSINDTTSRTTKIKAPSKSISSQPPPTIDILQPKWLSMIIPSLASSTTAATTSSSNISYPKSIPILSALQSTTTTNDNDNDDGEKKPAAIPPKKESKEERLLRRMMGGGGAGR